MAPTLPTACGSLPPEGALRLRPGKAGSAALAWEVALPSLVAVCGLLFSASERGARPADR